MLMQFQFVRKNLGTVFKAVKKAVADPGRPDAAAGEGDREKRILRQRAAQLRRMGLTKREFREGQVRPGAETDPAVRRANVASSLWSGAHPQFHRRPPTLTS
jgi:hypothetical protein